MRRLQTFFVLFFLFSAAMKGQPSFNYRLAKEAEKIAGRDFYISRVLDATPDSVQGSVFFEGKYQKAAMKGGLEEGLTQYFTKCLPQEEGMDPVVLRVCGLYLSEEATLASEEAHVWLWVEFYREEGERLCFEYDAETVVTDARYMDVSDFHEALIRTAFHDVLNQYAKHLKEKDDRVKVRFTEMAVKKPSRGIWKYPDYYERFKHFPVQILDISLFSGIHMMGGEFQYQHYFEGPYKPVRFPLTLSLGTWKFKKTHPGETGAIFYMAPGGGVMLKLDPFWSCNFGFGLPVGWGVSQYRQEKRQNGFLYGGMLRQSVFYQPRPDQRWGLKVTGYQHFLMDNKIFRKDFGIGLGLVFLVE